MARKPAKRARKTRTPLLQRLRTDFLAGLVVILPLFLTAYIVWWTVGFVDDKVIPLIPRSYNPQNVFGRNIFGLGLILFIIFTTLVGALAKNLIGRTILQMGETILGRTPIIRPIYNGLKQIAETLFTAKGNSFEQACLVEYPRRGAWCVAFMTSGVSRNSRAGGRAGPRQRLHPLLAKSDDRHAPLRAARRHPAAGDEPRGRGQADHLGRSRDRHTAAPRTAGAGQDAAGRRGGEKTVRPGVAGIRQPEPLNSRVQSSPERHR